MPRSVFPRWTLIACAAGSLALPPAMAAELGEMTVQSHVGQPLQAEIELTALAPEEAHGVAVRLASADVYRGGGIGMDAALQTLTITPVERGGRRYVRVATQQAIQAGHVHLYLLLGNGSGAVVRLATLWLTPAPPAPPAPPVAIVLSRPAVMLAPAVAPPLDAAALAARARAEGMLRPPAIFVPPPAPAKAAAVIRPPVTVRPPPLRRPAVPVAACAPQADAAQAEACLALDQKNAALNDKLGELEGKIGALQKALAQPATAVAAFPAAAAAAPAVPQAPHAKPKPLVAPAGGKEKKAGGNGLLWLGAGTLVFLLLTAAIVYYLRKRKEAGQAVAPSKYWVLLRKPFRRKPALPVLTEAQEEANEDAQKLAPEPEPFSR